MSEIDARSSEVSIADELGRIQREAAAERILEFIVKDLRAAPCGWHRLDVDDRNALVSDWRKKILAEIEEFF